MTSFFENLPHYFIISNALWRENGEVVVVPMHVSRVDMLSLAAEVTKAIPSPDEAEVVETEADVGEVSEKAFKSGGF